MRDEHGMSGEFLARAVGYSRQQLSALENGHVGPDVDLVSAICEYLAVGVKRRTAIMEGAADGWARGWWMADAERMGARQAIYADLESGTRSITEYAPFLIPGLLQTPAFADARMRSEPARHTEPFESAQAVAARARRQQLLLAPDGPHYNVVLDEGAIRRSAAEPHIVADQLRHILNICATHSSVKVRVLPIDITIKGHSAMCSPYSIYHYRDAPSSIAVAIDTLNQDLIHTETHEIDPYLSLHGRLKAAALDSERSFGLLRAAAQAYYRQES